MASALLDMTLQARYNNTGKAIIYYNQVVLTSGSESDIFFFPEEAINDIAASISGDGSIEVVNTPKAIIQVTSTPESSLDWQAWDGITGFNKALTAFIVRRTSGTVTATMAIRTQNA